MFFVLSDNFHPTGHQNVAELKTTEYWGGLNDPLIPVEVRVREVRELHTGGGG